MSDLTIPALQPEQATNLDTVPVIVLPQQTGRPQDSPQERHTCPDCKWDGSLNELFQGTTGRYLERPLGRTECSSCQLLMSISQKLAGWGRDIEENDAYIDAIGPHHTLTVKGRSEPNEDPLGMVTFTTMDTPEWVVESCGIYRRQWTEADALCGSSARFARNCINDCLESHEKCNSQRDSSFLPTRLINVAKSLPDGDPRLEERRRVPSGSRYVALSYCWGGVKPDCMTTLATVSDRMKKIPWDTLPATFQDAVHFTRSLGVDYLWIDSVCIIQGDEEDWIKEAGNMFHVYKDSYVTLAALGGVDSNRGLRSSSNRADSTLVAELQVGDSRWPVYIHREHYLTGFKWERQPSHETLRDEDNYPLLSRAWTYQERMISPRVLFFTNSEVIFQCFSDADCECGAIRQDSDWMPRVLGGPLKPLPKSSLINTILHILSVNHDSQVQDELGNKPSGDVQERAANSWRLRVAYTWRSTIASHYSVLKLTAPGDRLAALGAIAEQFQTARPGEKYLAGLWSGSLMADLLWETKNTEGLPIRRNSLPTWSWASVTGAISYLLLDDMSDFINSADIMSATCNYAGENGFIVLDSSTLVVRGRIMRCMTNWYLDQSGKAQCRLLYSKQGSWSGFSGGMVTTEKPWSLPPIQLDHRGTADARIPADDELYVLQIMQSHKTVERWNTTEMSRLWGKESEQVPSTRAFLLLRCIGQDEGVRIYSRMGIWAWEGGSEPRANLEEMRARFDVVFDEQNALEECEIR